MRVLVSGVVLAQPMGGVVRHNRELLGRLASLLADLGGSLAVMEGREPIPFALPDSIERLASDVPPRPALVRAAREARALRGYVERASEAGRPFDLLHTAHLPVPRRLPLPYSLTLHDLKALFVRHTPFSRRLVARHVVGSAVERAAAVLVVSEALRREVIERWPAAAERVHVVPNGADHLRVLPRSPAADAPLVCVAHLEPRKNQELLLRALAAAPDLPRLELVGEPRGDEGDRLADLARELGVAGRVRFLGGLADGELSELYAGAAACVLPSRREGFGIPAAEAQRAGVPLAVSTDAALREVAGEAAPTFDPDDVAGCVTAIRAALAAGEADLARSAERAGRYTWDAAAAFMLRAWQTAALGP